MECGITSALLPQDRFPKVFAKALKAAGVDPAADVEVLSVQWTHRHYVKDDEYIPYGEDIAAFLAREIAKPIIRWEDSPQLGYGAIPYVGDFAVLLREESDGDTSQVQRP